METAFGEEQRSKIAEGVGQKLVKSRRKNRRPETGWRRQWDKNEL